jgi:hypothetical protein
MRRKKVQFNKSKRARNPRKAREARNAREAFEAREEGVTNEKVGRERREI